jgi:hypothetical protein
MLGFLNLVLRLVETRLRLVYVVSSWRLYREEAEDGCVDVMDYIGPFYPKIIISSVLGPSDIVVF